MAKHASDWKQDSFCMIYASDAKELYKQKILSAEAYVLMIVKIHSKAGWKWTFDPKEFCAEWEISRSTFYRAVSRLKDKGFLNWEVEGKITVWHGSDIASEPVQHVRPPVQHVGLSIPDVGRPVQHVDNLQPEPLAGGESCPTPDSSQIFLKSTDNWTVAEKKKLNEEKEADKTADEVAEPPVIAAHSTSLPAQGEATRIEPTIPNVDNSSAQSLNIDEALEHEEIEDEIQPTTEELREVLQHLRAVGITLNHTIRAVVKRYYPFVNDALAHLKERISLGEKFRSLEGAFVKACREGSKPENKSSSGGVPEEINPPLPSQLAALEAAKASGKIKDYFLSSDGVCKVVMPNLHTQMPWWEYLNSTPDA
jgi:hypothetical protein